MIFVSSNRAFASSTVSGTMNMFLSGSENSACCNKSNRTHCNNSSMASSLMSCFICSSKSFRVRSALLLRSARSFSFAYFSLTSPNISPTIRVVSSCACLSDLSKFKSNFSSSESADSSAAASIFSLFIVSCWSLPLTFRGIPSEGINRSSPSPGALKFPPLLLALNHSLQLAFSSLLPLSSTSLTLVNTRHVLRSSSSDLTSWK
mmetsp:Transcript_4434/g.8100  ORF Transcript_4434/g.8100 Transcript_4434/m.8100 type:complete len:205 (+) Transcript_4434:1479-2093(+)